MGSPQTHLTCHLEDEQNHPTDKDSLKQLVQKAYDSITIDTINSLIYSFEYRIKMCYDIGGKTIAHFLQKMFHSIHPQYHIPIEKCPEVLSPDLNLLIYKEKIKTHHRLIRSQKG